MRRNMIGWWVMAVLFTVSTPAVAHVNASSPVDLTPARLETVTAAAPSLDGLGTLAVAMAVALVLVARRRRAVAVACVALLLLVAFESGVHSVHHLADQPDGQCVVASASAHTGGIAVTTIAFGRPVEAFTALAIVPTDSPSIRPAAPDLGRAPPLA